MLSDWWLFPCPPCLKSTANCCCCLQLFHEKQLSGALVGDLPSLLCLEKFEKPVYHWLFVLCCSCQLRFSWSCFQPTISSSRSPITYFLSGSKEYWIQIDLKSAWPWFVERTTAKRKTLAFTLQCGSIYLFIWLYSQQYYLQTIPTFLSSFPLSSNPFSVKLM